MIRCLLIDDEQPAINILRRYVERTPGLKLIGAHTDPQTGMNMIREQLPDLVFLDIQMDPLSGTDLAKTMDKSSRIIFTTAFREFGAESYDFGVIDYLVKPFSFSRFSEAVEKVKVGLARDARLAEQPPGENFFFLKTGTRGSRIKVDLNEVEYIEALNNYVRFNGPKKPVVAYTSLKEVSFRLSASAFMRIHKSFIISLTDVEGLENCEVIMKRSGTRIPLSIHYKEVFLDWMKTNMAYIGSDQRL